MVNYIGLNPKLDVGFPNERVCRIILVLHLSYYYFKIVLFEEILSIIIEQNGIMQNRLYTYNRKGLSELIRIRI